MYTYDSTHSFSYSAYVSMFMRHLCEPDTPNSVTHTDGVPKMSVPRQNILTRIGVMKLIKNKVHKIKILIRHIVLQFNQSVKYILKATLTVLFPLHRLISIMN